MDLEEVSEDMELVWTAGHFIVEPEVVTTATA
jgi:hypothetical protein